MDPNGNFMGNTTMNPEIWDRFFSESTSIIAFLHFPGEVQSFDVDLDFSMLLQGFCLIQKGNSMTRFSHDRRWQFTHLPLALPNEPTELDRVRLWQ